MNWPVRDGAVVFVSLDPLPESEPEPDPDTSWSWSGAPESEPELGDDSWPALFTKVSVERKNASARRGKWRKAMIVGRILPFSHLFLSFFLSICFEIWNRGLVLKIEGRCYIPEFCHVSACDAMQTPCRVGMPRQRASIVTIATVKVRFTKECDHWPDEVEQELIRWSEKKNLLSLTDDGVDAETSLSLSLHLYLSSPPLHFILMLTFGQ